MTRGIAFAFLALVSTVASSVAAHAQTRICNSGNVAVHLAYALDANYTVVNGWHELKPGDCREESFGYWLAIRQADQQGRLGIADYRPEFGQRPVFYDNMSRAFCVNPMVGFSNSIALSGDTCATGQERVRFGAYARQVDGGLFAPTWSIPTKPEMNIALFGSGDSNQLDANSQQPQLDAGDQAVLDIVGKGVTALLNNTLPELNLDKYNSTPSGPAPWSQVEDGARKQAKSEECFSIYKSFYHCEHRLQLSEDGYRHVPCSTRLSHYKLCQAGDSAQLKAELDTYSKRAKERDNIIPIVRQKENLVTWEYGKVPPTFHPSLADAEAVAGGKRIQIYMGKDGDGVLTAIGVHKFKRDEWGLRDFPPLPPEKRKLISEDQRSIQDGFILECIFYQPSTQKHGHRYYWYRQVPAAAEPTRLKGRVSDHPLLEFGEARESCPIKLDDATSGRLKNISMHTRLE